MPVKGELNFPGDKSISHRLLMLASLADGDSLIYNISTGEDVESTRKCLEDCGIVIKDNEDYILIKGGGLKSPNVHLNCGNSGTTVRLLMGLLIGKGIEAEFYGDKSLLNRPMNRIILPLSKMGAVIKSNKGKLPIHIKKSQLKGIDYKSPIPSAQLKSSILFAGLGAIGNTLLNEPYKSRDHTEKLLHFLGANLIVDGLNITLKPSNNSLLSNFTISVPGDPSTASFFATAAALIPGSELILKGILYNKTRIGFFNLLKEIGVGVEWISKWEEAGEIVGDLKVYYKNLKAIKISGDLIPGLIDEIPLVAILATQSEGRSRISGAKELRIKECDRITAICLNLKNMGVNIIEKEDGFIISGPVQLKGTNIKTYNDHRIAMAFSIAGMISIDKVKLDNPNCVSISYPEFYKTIDRISV